MKNYNNLLSTQLSIMKLPNFRQKDMKFSFEWTEQSANYTKQILETGFSKEDSENINKTINDILDEYKLNLTNQINQNLMEKLNNS